MNPAILTHKRQLSRAAETIGEIQDSADGPAWLSGLSHVIMVFEMVILGGAMAQGLGTPLGLGLFLLGIVLLTAHLMGILVERTRGDRRMQRLQTLKRELFGTDRNLDQQMANLVAAERQKPPAPRIPERQQQTRRGGNGNAGVVEAVTPRGAPVRGNGFGRFGAGGPKSKADFRRMG